MASRVTRSTTTDKKTKTGNETASPTEDIRTNNKRGKLWLTCTYCFIYGTDRPHRLKEHMRRCKAGPKEQKGSERDGLIEESLGKIRNAHEVFGKNIFFNPRDFDDRAYSKDDVMNILLQYGHSAVTEETESKCNIQPFPVNVTGRTFDKTSGQAHHPTIKPYDESNTEEIQSDMEVAEEEPEVQTYSGSETEGMQVDTVVISKSLNT
ncbi:uncharacterized protein LOC125663047 [Ostrea edulis]|uniref:uncharacterized protein LOC125663047 n=1 Tax=Ostrea edulis TaxID=37623 RepID=UPI0024AEEF6C|nr:uncharacterized protein LOC125663047 [Ostrea edulis]